MAGLNKLVVDTNVLIYFTKENQTAQNLIRENSIYISVVTKMEMLSFAFHSHAEREYIKLLLSTFTVVPLNESVQEKAIELRRKYSLKLPDAIIAATAYNQGCFLVSADKKLQGIKEIKIIAFNAP